MNNGPDPKTFIAIGAIAFVASAGLCYIPYSRLNANRAKVAQLAPKVKAFSAVQQDLQTSQTQLASDQSSLAHLEANVSSAAYVPSLLLDVDHFGHECGIQVTGVRPQTPAPTPPIDPKVKVAAKPYDELTIDVTGTGSYAAAVKFLQGLSMFPKIVEARTVTILPVSPDPKDPGASKGQLSITIELRAFVFKQDQSATVVPNSTTNGKPAGTANGGSPNQTPASTPGQSPALGQPVQAPKGNGQPAQGQPAAGNGKGAPNSTSNPSALNQPGVKRS